METQERHACAFGVENTEAVPHVVKKNRNRTFSAEVRIILYLDNGTKLNAVRRIRFSEDEIEATQ